MGHTIGAPFVLFIVSILFGCYNSKEIGVLVRNPLKSSESIEIFSNVFIKEVIESEAFDKQGDIDLERVTGILVEAIRTMVEDDNQSSLQLRTLIIAFASAIADIVVEESDTYESIELKTEAVINALKAAFKRTTGEVNVEFITDVKILVDVFARIKGNMRSQINKQSETSNMERIVPAILSLNIGNDMKEHSGKKDAQAKQTDTGTNQSERNKNQKSKDKGSDSKTTSKTTENKEGTTNDGTKKSSSGKKPREEKGSEKISKESDTKENYGDKHKEGNEKISNEEKTSNKKENQNEDSRKSEAKKGQESESKMSEDYSEKENIKLNESETESESGVLELDESEKGSEDFSEDVLSGVLSEGGSESKILDLEESGKESESGDAEAEESGSEDLLSDEMSGDVSGSGVLDMDESGKESESAVLDMDESEKGSEDISADALIISEGGSESEMLDLEESGKESESGDAEAEESGSEDLLSDEMSGGVSESGVLDMDESGKDSESAVLMVEENERGSDVLSLNQCLPDIYSEHDLLSSEKAITRVFSFMNVIMSARKSSSKQLYFARFFETFKRMFLKLNLEYDLSANDIYIELLQESLLASLEIINAAKIAGFSSVSLKEDTPSFIEAFSNVLC